MAITAKSTNGQASTNQNKGPATIALTTASQIELLEKLKKECDSITNSAQVFSRPREKQDGDKKIEIPIEKLTETDRRKLNELNVNFHAKIAVMAHELEKMSEAEAKAGNKEAAEKLKNTALAIEDFTKITNNSIKEVIHVQESAYGSDYKLKYMDINGTIVSHNGITAPLHEHLHGHLFKNPEVL